MTSSTEDPTPGSEGFPDADATLVGGGDLPSAKVPLDRDRIVGAAIEFVDEFGLPGLSMRRLGARMGVEAMSLYRYVPGKEDLLDAVVETMTEQVDHDPEVLSNADDGWQDFLQRLAHGMRRVALSHPKIFPLVASRPAEAPWLRPPLRSLRWVDTFLEAMTGQGFTDAAAVAAYRAFTSFLLGHLLLEVSNLGADLGPLDVIADENEPDDALRDYPSVRRLRGGLTEDRAAPEFEESLESLLDRLSLMRAEQRR